MRILRFFIWVAVLAVVLLIWSGAGSPHAIWAYSFRPNGDPHNPFAERYYTSCTYIGWGFSRVTMPARDGRCPWVRFFAGGAGQ